MNGWTGYLRLAVERKGERTIPADIYSEGACKVTRPIYLEESGQPCFYLMNPGGGYVEGDRYRLEFELADDAELLLTTQSSTKIYKCRQQSVCQETHIRLGAGSLLEYLPDPLIAYQHADYQQKTMIQMDRSATLIYADAITPGWSPDGSLFPYKSVQLKTEVYLEDELVVYDHLRFRPDASGLQGLGRLDGATHVGSMIVIGEQTTPEFLERLHEKLVSPEQTGSGPVRVGLSSLRVPGFTLRVLASSTQEIERLFAACQQFVRQEWFSKPPVSLRKL
jgi:urease accessory protein